MEKKSRDKPMVYASYFLFILSFSLFILGLKMKVLLGYKRHGKTRYT